MSQFIEMFGDPIVNDKQWPDYSCLSEVTQIVLGSTPNSKEPSYWDGDIRWITPAEMKDQSYYIYDTVRHITEEGRDAANLTMLPEGTVLFSTRAPIGKVAIAGKEMCCNQGFKNFICSEKLNKVFLYYTLKYKKDHLCSLGTGTTFKELSKKTVESLKVAVPPIDLQERFEDTYNQADKSEFDGFKSQFIEMFKDTPIVKLEDYISTQSGGTPNTKKHEYYDDGDIPWLSSGEVNQGYIDSTEKFITQAGLDNSSAKWVPKDCVVIAMYGATAGKVGYIRIPLTTNQAVCSLLPSNEFNSIFLYYAVSQKTDWMISQCRGAAQPNISQGIIRSMELPLPSMSEQNKFVAIAEQADKSESELRKSIESINKVIKSLINENL